MTSFLARVFMVLTAVAVLAACAAETQQTAKVEPKPAQTPPAPAPSASQPPAKPGPAPAATAPRAPASAQAAKPPASTPTTTPAPAAPEPPKAPGETPQALVVSVGRANMREKPETKARIVQVLTKGTKLVVVSKAEQWYRVRLTDGTEGWVAESVVSPATP